MKVFDFEVTLENSENDIKKLYTLVRPDVRVEDIEYNNFKEGVVNLIVKLDDPKHREPIVIRTYALKIKAESKKNGDDGFDISKFQNRKLELAALKAASDLGCTVELVATYNNGFIYKYVDGDVNSIKLYDLDTAKKVAKKMARFHMIDLSGMTSDKPAVHRFLKNESFDEITKTFDQKMKDSRHEEFRNFLPTYSELKAEYERLHHLVVSKNAYGKVCFCHNDLNMTNLLIEKSTKEPLLIDFEWSDKNYEMYDISYHIVNMAGLFCQYFKPDDVPSDDFIRHWLRSYHEEANKLNGVQMTDDEYAKLVDNELKKVLVNMLLIRLQLTTRGLFFEFMFSKEPKDSIKDYCVSVYKDFANNRDKHLALLDTLV